MSTGFTELRARLTRRRLLALGVGVGALTIAGSVGWLVSLPTPAPGRQALSEREGELLVRLAEVWFPPGNPLGVAAADVDIGGELDRLLVLLSAREQRALHALLRVVDQLPRASLSSSARFSALPLAERRALISGWERSGGPKRQLAGVLRLLAGLSYFEDERVRRAIGHVHGCPLPLPVAG
ncbi:MAG: hypothetical protein HYS27_16210 [Deltaproteobacteria bacterium]|nr:hypothetical protein [Deltaproteobacteria bacterium]